MRCWLRLVMVTSLATLACGSSPGVGADAGAADAGGDAAPISDIAGMLSAIPGMTVMEKSPGPNLPGYRFFLLTYDQPADHANPLGAHFPQHMALLHRDASAPMILYSSGYSYSTTPARVELTKLVNGNQLYVEHRYFAGSAPNPIDWTDLTIAQAAADHHSIIQALKPIYGGKWLSTGGSKGGMTSIFHRRFYPADVDGTVAYVAPISFPADETEGAGNVYIPFLQTVGGSGDASCRQALKDFQNLVLTTNVRAAVLAQMDALITSQSTSWNILTEAHALEFMVEELPFAFWQYGSDAECGQIPTSAASASAIYAFLDQVVDVYSYSDDGLIGYVPYYYQSATQLAYPADDESYLVGLMSPGQDTAAAYLPAGVGPAPYDNGAAMNDIQTWVQTEGSQLLFVYGQDDPWGAAAYALGSAVDSFELFVPGGNHESQILQLAAGDQAIALDAIGRWSGVTPIVPLPLHKAREDDLMRLDLRRLRHRR